MGPSHLEITGGLLRKVTRPDEKEKLVGVGGGSALNAVFAIEEIMGLGDLRRRIATVSSSCSWST